jgi:hypothetical protein
MKYKLIVGIVMLVLLVASVIGIGTGTPVGSQAGVNSLTTTGSSNNCKDPVRCNEIDFVWNRIKSVLGITDPIVPAVVNPGVGPNKKSETSQDEELASYPEGSTSYEFNYNDDSVPSIVGLSSSNECNDLRNSIVLAAETEWDYWKSFDNYNNDECKIKGRIKQNLYFSAANGERVITESNCHDASNAWSAAFISYVMKEAGVNDFPVNVNHVNYFRKILNNEISSLVTKPMDRIDEIGIGDILCQCRGTGCSIDYNNFPTNAQPGHCDIVVKIEPGKIWTIGGNLGDTVKMLPRTNGPSYFGFITPSVCHTSS